MGVPAPTGKVLAGDGEKGIADDEKRDGTGFCPLPLIRNAFYPMAKMVLSPEHTYAWLTYRRLT